MFRIAAIIGILLCAASVSCADAGSDGSLMPRGVRAIASPDDCSIILVSDPTNGTGKGLQWLGIGGAIACDADNSIIVWSRDYVRPAPYPPPATANPIAPLPAAASPQGGQQFLWPEGIEYAVPFDLDNSIILKSD